MSACEIANLGWVGWCKPRVLTAELSPAQWMEVRLFAGQPPSSGAAGMGGILGEDPWHRSQAIIALKAGGYLARQ